MTKSDNKNKGRDVYIVDGARTPFLKAKGPGAFSASDLAVQVGRTLLARQNFKPNDIDEVIIGCAMPGPDEANIARVIALRLGCGNSVPAFTVMRNCASGMQAIDDAYLNITTGRSELVLAGGTEAMSHAPLLFNEGMAKWLSQWFMAKSLSNQFQLVTKFKPSYLTPVIALLRGLTDPIVGLNMGQTAEKVAHRFNISRDEMDEFAYQSHHKVAKAYDEGRMSEVVPMIDSKGKVYLEDDGLRRDTTLEKLAKLKPFFDKKYGMVTAGNSSQVTDGAALLILASKEAVEKYNLPVKGIIKDVSWGALDPAEMGLGPVHASAPILKRHNLKPDDFDAWEINEAFAAQVIGCMRAFDDENYCKEELGFSEKITAPSLDKLNKDGGAIALGHPIGASGARIVLHALNVLEQNNGKKAMAAICIGGGQGGAMYVERTTEVK